MVRRLCHAGPRDTGDGPARRSALRSEVQTRRLIHSRVAGWREARGGDSTSDAVVRDGAHHPPVDILAARRDGGGALVFVRRHARR